MVKGRTKGGKLGGRSVRNVFYNSEKKIYAHSLEEAGKRKKVRLINEVVDVWRDRECEEVEERSVDTGAGDINMNVVDGGL